MEDSHRHKKAKRVEGTVVGLTQGGVPREKANAPEAHSQMRCAQQAPDHRDEADQDVDQNANVNQNAGQNVDNEYTVLLQPRILPSQKQMLTLEDACFECYAGCFVFRKQVRDFNPHFQKYRPSIQWDITRCAVKVPVRESRGNSSFSCTVRWC